jgi:hypothetical protein
MTLIVDKIGPEFKLDGYDVSPDYGKYQMVPVGGKRTLSIKTDQRPVKVEITRNAGAVLIGRFRQKGGGPVEGIEPGRMSNNTTFKIPAKHEVDFDVEGQSFANAFVSVAEIGDDITFSEGIIIGVKPKITKKIAFVFFSDLRGDVKPAFVQKGIDPRAILAKANSSFLAQLNLELEEVEPGRPIAEVASARNFGDPIGVDDLMDPEKVQKSFVMATEVFKSFPTLFPKTHFVVMLTRPVTSKRQSKVIDINIKFSGNTNVIFLTPSTSGADENIKAFMHEVGHACGAQHVSTRPSIMFPSLGASLTMRFLGEHIESVHNVGPVFPLD